MGKKSYETSLQLHRQDFFAFIHPSRFSPPSFHPASSHAYALLNFLDPSFALATRSYSTRSRCLKRSFAFLPPRDVSQLPESWRSSRTSTANRNINDPVSLLNPSCKRHNTVGQRRPSFLSTFSLSRATFNELFTKCRYIFGIIFAAPTSQTIT